MPEPVTVIDAAGQRLSPCSEEKAQAMLDAGKATLVSSSPRTIRLPFTARLRTPREPEPYYEGRTLLLHICCGPCSTASIEQLRRQGFAVSGFWYNPNVHPQAEHDRRRECAEDYAQRVSLPLIHWHDYDMPAFFRAVAGHESHGERCAICYRLRLECTARVARDRGFEFFSTTLLISPYQQQALIRKVGEELGQLHGVDFYFENLRKGWSERGRLSRELGLYQQRYCGCLYSEWEASQHRSEGSGG